ncbi:DEKNAAE101983 [Brettanomyces naardenensis]|uniref:DEKNAAE101983 n=1 Tax=Brettanomyces naardenensis TaxID=13370 RepID=A0A448YJH7_BRENA|nr:DEKNAAE101983 [Brettanomyces naardenensis]
MSSLSDFILMYDDVANKFRMERFGGVIKMNKSREPDVLENRLVDIKKKHRTKTLDKENGFIPSLVDSLLQSSKPDDAPTISYTQSMNQISFPKRTHSHSRVPSPADDSVHIRSSSSQTTQKPVISRMPSRTSTQTCSLSDSGISTVTRIRKQKQRPKKSKLLRAAKRALSKSPKVKMARLIPVENINARPVKEGISVPISKSPKIVSKESPGELSDDEEEESTSSQSTEHVMSDQDLADFADDLEEELDEDNKTDGQLPVSRNIDDVMEKSTGGGSTQGDDLRLDFSDLENAVEESPDDSVDEDGNGKGFQVVVEDNPRLMKSQRRVSESRISSLSDTSFPLSPLPKRPISMRKLAVSGNLMSRGSTPLGVSSPRISIDTPMLESGASSPSSSPPSKESARAEEVEDDTPDDDIEFDEEELDRALDDLDDEVSEAE